MRQINTRGDWETPASRIFHTNYRGMRTSAEARIRKDRLNASGNGSVYLQIIINGKRCTVPLKVSWPVAHFDNKSGKFLERWKNDQEALDLNLDVRKEKGKINDIFMFYRHSDRELSTEQFLKEYRRYESRKDFLSWCRSEVQFRYEQHDISLQTYKHGKSHVKRLREFQPYLPFSQINEDLMKRIALWGSRKGYSHNHITGMLVWVRTYARRAYKSGIGVDVESVSEFKIPRMTNKTVYLVPNEITRLQDYYNSTIIPQHQHRVLSYFLFSCNTGLRFSDIQRVQWKHIRNRMIEIIPYKTRKSQKVNRIPLTEKAAGYIQNHGGKGYLFDTLTEQATNRTLKDIAVACDIRLNLTTHVARHTFATEFLRRGGHLEVLQKLLGHESITTTMVYGHVDGQRLWEEMAAMED